MSFSGGVMLVVLTKEQIIDKILSSTSITKEELLKKIHQKLDQLSGLVSEEGAAHIIANELGVQLIPSTNDNLKIENLLEGLRNVKITLKVIKKYDVKEFNSARGPGKLASFLAGDDSGVVRVTLWNSAVDNFFDKFKEQDVLEINNAYVRKNNYTNNLELNLSDSSNININPEGVIVELKNKVIKRKINEIEANDFRVEILGTIVQISDIRFWEICPKCNKKLKSDDEGFKCVEHGLVNPSNVDYSYVLNCYIDDGSGNIRTVFWKEQIQKLISKTHEEIIKFKESPEDFEDIKNDLLGEFIKLVARVNKNNAFDRLELVAESVDLNPDPNKEINDLTPVKETNEPKEEVISSKQEETSFKQEEDIVSIDDIEEIRIDDD